jgi:all-trans-retinol 13,14-reductase
MLMTTLQHDIIIIGSGMGGLLSGAILSKEGYNVGVIEQHKQIGGCLQSFSFRKKLFDSCVHYIGGLNKDNSLYKIFDYVEILDHLQLIPYEKTGFDNIVLQHLDTSIALPQGYDNFVATLIQHFPEEKNGIIDYINYIKFTIKKFPLYKLSLGNSFDKMEVLNIKLKDVLDQYFHNNTLKQLLTGNSILYAGHAEETPFFIHALVLNSYIESAHKVKGSSAQIAKMLGRTIQKYGSTIYKREKVTSIISDLNKIEIQTNSGKKFQADKCISNIHPNATFQLLHANKLKSSFTKRVAQAPNSVSSFMVNAILKEKTIAYKHQNIYVHHHHPLDTISNIQSQWHEHFALYFNEDEQNPGYAESVSILCYMDYKAFQLYDDTFNTATFQSNRSHAYQQYKENFAQQLLKTVQSYDKHLVEQITSYKIASPLTFRDYMGTDDGSMYGMIAHASAPLQSLLPVQTKVPNIYLTGQNINMHGILGVSITALATCGEIIGLEKLLAKINA